MTNLSLFRKFSYLPYFFAVGAALSACSGSEDNPGGAGGSGGTGATSATAGQTSTSGSGNNTSGSSGSSTGGTPSGSTDIVGSFGVQVVVDEKDPTTGTTKIIGKVNDGKSPANLVWTEIKKDGDCRVEKPSSPFCDPSCGGEAVCVADDTCLAYPTAHSVGEVTLSGVKLAAGETSIMLKEVAKAYQPPANTAFAWPPFAEGDEVKVKAAGGDYAGFELSAKGIKPMVLTSTTFEVTEGKALELKWEAATDPKASQIHLKLDISHHGGTRGMIQCDTDDTGSLTISGDLITELIGLGTAGFPTFVLTRSTRDQVQIAPGIVELEISAKVEQAVTVAGVTSCTEDPQCPDGQTCLDDLTCGE